MEKEDKEGRGKALTFSIALLVRPSFDPFLAFFALGIDTFLRDAVFDAAEARTGVVAFLARLLAVCAGVLDLPALGARCVVADHAWWEGVHVHGHARVGSGDPTSGIDGMDGHGGGDGVLWRGGGAGGVGGPGRLRQVGSLVVWAGVSHWEGTRCGGYAIR